MNTITVLTPLADGHAIEPAATHGLDIQTMPCRRVCVSRPMNMTDRRLSEAECRNILRQYADGEFCMMMDAGMICTSPMDVADAIAALTQRVDYDALCYNTKESKTVAKLESDRTDRHIDIGWMIIRSEVLRRINFMVTVPGGCLCHCVNQQCKIDWVDYRQLREVGVTQKQP